jgi:hypothetical protein
LATFDPDAGKRGRQFEHFVKWFLKNDPEWATQVDEELSPNFGDARDQAAAI